MPSHQIRVRRNAQKREGVDSILDVGPEYQIRMSPEALKVAAKDLADQIDRDIVEKLSAHPTAAEQAVNNDFGDEE